MNSVDIVLLADHPENIELCLPSALPSASRNAQCTNDLPRLEYRLRYAQATGALHNIRRFRQLIKVMSQKTQSHISNTQKTVTRTRSLFERVRTKLAIAVSTYRAARKAIEHLAPNEEFGSWKSVLLELEDKDVRGPGREEGDRSGTFVQSWIWKTATEPSLAAGNPDLHDAIRIEWCRVHERAKRYEEEVELTIEEMRRTLASFEWDAREWKTFATFPPAGDFPDEVVISGIVAYANKQADLLRRMADKFVCDWYYLLKTFPRTVVPWLKDFKSSPPPKIKRRRLVSNVKLYHPAFYTPENESYVANEVTSDAEEVAFDVIDNEPVDAIVDSLEDSLNDLL